MALTTLPQQLRAVVEWIKALDTKEVVYALLATVAAATYALWSGLFRRLKTQLISIKSTKAYRKGLRERCSSLTVIGRRQGFSMEDVYIPLDLSVSDLCPDRNQRPVLELSRSCVLVAGPGAGKSTIVKDKILEKLRYHGPLPFLVRLREYVPSKSLEEHIAAELRRYGVPTSRSVVAEALSQTDSFCVLDGLDEVRPNIAESVCERINAFYQQFFREKKGVLVVTCRKEAYRELPLDIRVVLEVRPLTDPQIRRFAKKWPLGYPTGKTADTFLADLFATPSVHELARSPLLLVGGLMQYTESNLGVPEERVQYLARVGQWLVSDWAAAQDHPPDSFRPVYQRVLSKLAYHMHENGVAEINVSQAIDLLSTILPGYGIRKEQAQSLLESIKLKTGILVGDLPDVVVFSQFGLQEYYASIDLLQNIEEKNLVDVAKEVWWREALLLAIAQQKEPSAYLTSMFGANPLLAAEAVAECPTPSLVFQDEAIEACIRAIDANVSAARSAAVPLLRKVKDVQEQHFITELEKRLSTENTAKTAGVILAVAGTAAATDALARHPAIWKTSMQAAGYLSTSLENLLIGWIEGGDEGQTRHATELLQGRLSADRFQQLIRLLPNLTATKADLVAQMLLENIAETSAQRFRESDSLATHIGICAARIKDPMSWARLNLKDPLHRGNHDPSDFVLAALALKQAKNNIDPDFMQRILLHAGAWAEGSRELTIWIGSALVVAMSSGGRMSRVATLAGLLLVALSAGGDRWRSFHPNYPMFLVIRAAIPRVLIISVLTLGACGMIAIGINFATPRTEIAFWRGLAFSSACALTAGCLAAISFPRRFDFCKACITFRVARLVGITWLLILGLLAVTYEAIPTLPRSPVRLLGLSVAMFFLFSAYLLFRDFNALRLAAMEFSNSMWEENDTHV